MLSPEQIRAARALLDWSTAELARRTGLTVNGLNKIERGHVNAQRDTLEKIQKVFEEAGLEFIPGKGLRRRNHLVTTYEGKDHRILLDEDIYNTLKNTGGEFLVAHEIEEDVVAEDMGIEYLKNSLYKRKRANITHRLLVLEDDPGLFGPFDTYHVIDKKYFSPYPMQIYGANVSFSTRQYAPKSIVIRDENIAESARKLFNFVWDNTKGVPKERQNTPKAKELYDYVWGKYSTFNNKQFK